MKFLWMIFCALSAVTAQSQTLSHRFGDLPIQADAQRIVSLGYTDQDDLWVLGVKPIAVAEWYGNHPYAAHPWALEAKGESKPLVLAAMDYEKIAELKPDLIVAVYRGIDDDQYQKLAAIAPTLTSPAGVSPWKVPWDQRLMHIAKALGREEQGQQHIDQLKSSIQALAAELKVPKGTTLAPVYGTKDHFYVYNHQDARAQIYQQLGFEIPAAYAELSEGKSYFTLSLERLDLIDQDWLIWELDPDLEFESLTIAKLRTTLTAYKQGRERQLSPLGAAAFGFGSALSMVTFVEELGELLK